MPRYRILHLLIALAVACVAFAMANRQTVRRASVTVEKYEAVPLPGSKGKDLWIAIRFPSRSIETRHAVYSDLIREDLESGDDLEFAYRANGFLGHRVESPETAVWRNLFAKPKTQQARDHLNSILRFLESTSAPRRRHDANVIVKPHND